MMDRRIRIAASARVVIRPSDHRNLRVSSFHPLLLLIRRIENRILRSPHVVYCRQVMAADVSAQRVELEFGIHFVGLTEALRLMLLDLRMQCGTKRFDCVEALVQRKNSFASESSR
jgi:hypothetical protein